MLTPFNDEDQDKLDACSMERFRAFFTLILREATLYLSCDYTLVISGGEKIAQLAQEFDHLGMEAWCILGSAKISIYCCNQLIYEANIGDNWHKLGGKASGESCGMATAIQENLTEHIGVENGTQQLDALSSQNKIVRSMALADIAADLEADPASLQNFLQEHKATLIDFNGTILVQEFEAALAYEHYSVIRARQKMEERFAMLTSANSTIDSDIPKNIAPKERKPKKPSLTFKREFKVNKSSYKRTIQNFLDAMFPGDETASDLALSQIVQQTEMGLAYLDKIIRSGEYKDKTHAKDLLFKAAAELLSGMEAPKEEIVETAV